MKIKNLTLTLLGMVLLCAGMASCGKDEPKPKPTDGIKDGLENVVPETNVPFNKNSFTKIFVPNIQSENNSRFETTYGALYRFLLTPVAEYKLYNLENGKLTNSGQTIKLSTQDIINMFAGTLVFNNKGDLKIMSCNNNSLQNPSQTLNLTYTYDEGYITVGSNQSSDLKHIVINPVVKISKIVNPSQFDYFRPSVKEYTDKYIIVEENQDVVDFINNLGNFIIKEGKNKTKINLFTSDGETYCTLYPDNNVCKAFCLDIAIPFFYSMVDYADPEAGELLNSGVLLYYGNMTKDYIDKLKYSIENSRNPTVFTYTTLYHFSK